jgi:hypothetical protein
MLYRARAVLCGASAMDTSPEIKSLIHQMYPKQDASSAQSKYEAILQRKRYDHHCFIECVRLRLETHRGADTEYSVETKADLAFTHMLSHTLL